MIVPAGTAKYKSFPGVVERARTAWGMSGLTVARLKHRHPERSEETLVHRATCDEIQKAFRLEGVRA